MPHKTTLAAIAALALASTSADAFVAPSSSTSACSSSALSMGKSMAMPGPSKSSSSGPATSEYRMKKMSDRMKSKKKNKGKKKGGFGGADDDEEDTLPTGEKKIMDQELAAEPEGGEEVAPLVVGGAAKAGYTIRLKDLGPVADDDEAKYLESEDELGRVVHNFWLTAIADGNEIEKIRSDVLKQSAKNANFPGFRKGQIPPYAQPKMTNFALQEVLVTSCQEAITRFGVNEINEGQLGAVTFHENVEELSKKYNIRSFPSVPFTANFRATFDPEAVREGAIDVDAEAEAATPDAEEE
jgi:hypothetical protein